MNKKVYIFIGLIILSFLGGVICGTALGIQKGQYMLFEGLNEVFDGATINTEINLNETKLIEEFKNNLIPLLNETLQNSKQETIK